MELRLRLLVIVMFAYELGTSECAEVVVPVSVNRRLSGDLFSLSNSSHIVCSRIRNDTSPTYLVDERRCVNSQDLLDGI